MDTEGQITPQKPTESANFKLLNKFSVFLLSAILLIALALVGLQALYNVSKTNSVEKVESVATVNGKAISKRAFDDVVKVGRDPKKVLLDNLIKAEILNQYLLSKKVETSDQQVRSRVKYDTDIDAYEMLNARILLETAKIKPINGFTTDQQFDEWYVKEKSKAKIVITIKL